MKPRESVWELDLIAEKFENPWIQIPRNVLDVHQAKTGI